MKNGCPTHCGNSVKRGQLLCLSCWRLVPAPLRHGVWHAYEHYLRQGARGQRTPDDCRALVKAQDQAIASARERLIKKELSA